jgi:hypothetical protein
VLFFDGSMVGRDMGTDRVPDGGRSLDGSGAGDGGGHVDAAWGGSTDRFLPAVPVTYDGMIDEPGVEVLGLTVVPPDYEDLDPEVLVAVRNDSFDLRLCSLSIRLHFDDASGVEIGSSTRTIVDSPPHRGSHGSGGLMSCLSPGQTGMAAAITNFSFGRTRHEIAAIRWSVGALNVVDAVPTSNLTTTDVRVVTERFNFRFHGRMQNWASAPVQNPDVAVYGVNAVGRPIVEASDIELITVPAGGIWSFETLTFETDAFTQIVAFPSARDL